MIENKSNQETGNVSTADKQRSLSQAELIKSVPFRQEIQRKYSELIHDCEDVLWS